MFDSFARGPSGAAAFSSGSYVMMCLLTFGDFFDWSPLGIQSVIVAFVIWLLMLAAFLVWHWRIWYLVAPQAPFLLVAVRGIGAAHVCASAGYTYCVS